MVDHHPVIGKAACRSLVRLVNTLDLDLVEEHMRRCVAHRVFVFEYDQFACGHLAARGGAVVLE